MKKMNPAKVAEMLDSDDEFPTDYTEKPTVPAYQNDHRFDMIQFKWLRNASLKKALPKPVPAKPSSHVIIRPEKSNLDERPIVNRGTISVGNKMVPAGFNVYNQLKRQN